MTLSKQLGLSFLVILIIVFSGSLWINVNNTRNFIDLQLASHAQDTATSLGLSISPYMGESADLPIVETMMNAIFDSGYYQSIVLQDLNGTVLLEKTSLRDEQNAPDWFVDLFPLSPPSSQTEINNGWNIAGKLTIVSDPGIGYQQLWSNAKQSLWMFSLVFAFTLVLVWLLVIAITTPILAVVEQAKAISQRQFDTVKRIPRTPELRVFVEAINSMSLQLSKVFNQITNQAERYRNFAYTDVLTGQGNRRAFEMAFDRLVSDSEHQHHGYIVVLRLTSLTQVNQEFGFEAGDSYIKSLCAVMQQHSKKFASQIQIYRLNGADFALLLEDFDEPQTRSFVQAMLTDIINLEKTEYRMGAAHAGVAQFSYNDSLSKVMESADSALASASVNEAHFQFADALGVSQSNTQWREQLQELITLGKVEFVAQQVKSISGSVEYREWFARFKQPDSESFYPMAQLIPASIRLDYSQRLDQLVIQQALAKIDSSSHKVGLNISRLSLNDPNFHQWLLDILPQSSAQRARIVLEIPERALVHDVSKLKQLVEELRNTGVKICVEHFGAQLAAVTHLRDIRPDYLKIDGRFSRNIDKEQDNQLFVQSLINIAHGLNIKVIAEMVETQQEADCLKELAVDFIQGYLFGHPAQINN